MRFMCALNECDFHASGVYARGSKRSHTGGKCVTCRGLHILALRRTTLLNLSCVSPKMGCLEYIYITKSAGVVCSNPSGGITPRNFGNSVYPTFPVPFGRDTESLKLVPLFGVYARGSKRCHTGWWK